MLGAVGFAGWLLFAPLWAPLQDPTVKDFRRYFPKAKDTWERVEYVKALQGIDDPGVAQVLLDFDVALDQDPHVAAAGREVLAQLPSESARAPLRPILEKGKPAEHLPSVLRAAGEGRWVECTALVRPHLSSKIEDARLWAATAVGQLGDAESLPPLAALAVKDPGMLVRVAAVDSLGVLGKGHEDVAGPPLVAALADPALEVQTAACLALRAVRVKEAIGPLVDLLENGQGRILEYVYPTLIAITDNQFTDDPGLWRRWWTQMGATYQVPAEEELERRRAAREAAAAQYHPSRKEAAFLGVETPSTSMVFVIDVSGSMEEEVVDRGPFQERGFREFQKLAIVKEELVRTLQDLKPHVRFNIYAFATGVYPWRPKLVPANALNVRSATDFVAGLQPVGGQLAAERAAAGLSGSSGTEEGRTNTYAALLAGLGVEVQDNEVRTPAEGAAAEVKSKVDTMFFLSDGRPSVGELVDPDDILEAITELNRFRRVTIHTIAIGEFQKDFMLEMARRNGGTFVDLGR